MGFVAATAVEALDYDLGGGVTGTTPEPSQDQLDGFVAGLRAQAAGLVDGDGKVDPAKLKQLTEDAGGDTELARQQKATLVQAVAAVCSGQPSAEQLDQLPPRILQAYVGWLTGQLLNPPAPPVATRR